MEGGWGVIGDFHSNRFLRKTPIPPLRALSQSFQPTFESVKYLTHAGAMLPELHLNSKVKISCSNWIETYNAMLSPYASISAKL